MRRADYCRKRRRTGQDCTRRRSSQIRNHQLSAVRCSYNSARKLRCSCTFFPWGCRRNPRRYSQGTTSHLHSRLCKFRHRSSRQHRGLPESRTDSHPKQYHWDIRNPRNCRDSQVPTGMFHRHCIRFVRIRSYTSWTLGSSYTH